MVKTSNDIIQETAAKYGITVRAVRGKSREPIPIAARHEACFRLRRETQLTYRLIAKAIGWTHDPKTVLHAINSHEQRLEVAKLMLGTQERKLR